ncbi:hypothetical protein PVAP13_9KG078520 [Panicum virgatum]|uniref:Uncharacterized protein n=1 Tax=Panicum virgatum TaxID=38727 RepID=A0A8T0NBI2_PANVG|nr:hypothetical protein PVAP13_9KG078520 [Panicum virgatum]
MYKHSSSDRPCFGPLATPCSACDCCSTQHKGSPARRASESSPGFFYPTDRTEPPAPVTAGIDLVVVRVPNLSSVPHPVASVTAGSQEPRRRGALSPLPEQSRGKRQSGRFSCRPGAQGPRALAVIIELAAKATPMLTLCLCPSLCIGSIRSVVLQTSASGSDAAAWSWKNRRHLERQVAASPYSAAPSLGQSIATQAPGGSRKRIGTGENGASPSPPAKRNKVIWRRAPGNSLRRRASLAAAAAYCRRGHGPWPRPPPRLGRMMAKARGRSSFCPPVKRLSQPQRPRPAADRRGRGSLFRRRATAGGGRRQVGGDGDGDGDRG